MALPVCWEEADVASALMLLAKGSHVSEPAVSGMGKSEPPADSEVWPSRRESAEGNRALGSGPEADDERPGSVPGCWDCTLWAGRSHRRVLS